MGMVVLIGANGTNLKLGSQMGENFAGVLYVRNINKFDRQSSKETHLKASICKLDYCLPALLFSSA